MKNIKKIWILCTALLTALVLAGCGTNVEVDMASCLNFRASGMNGETTATGYLDTAGFEQTFKANWKGSNEEQMNARFDSLVSTFTLDCSPDMNLSNGDQVTVTLQYDQKMAKDYGIVLHNTQKTFTVEGREDYQLIDPFDPEFFGPDKDIHWKFKGVNGDGSLVFDNDASDFSLQGGLVFTCTPKDDLSNGDTITVTAEMPGPLFGTNPYRLTQETTTILVEGLPQEFTSLSQFHSEDVEKIFSFCEDTLRDRLSRDFKFYYADGDSSMKRDPAAESFAGCEFQHDCYVKFNKLQPIPGKLVIPFTVDLKDMATFYLDGQYYSDEIITDYPQAWGYCEVAGFRLDSDGNLLNDAENPLSCEISSIFETKEQMLRIMDIYNVVDGMQTDVLP